ncbi:MAG TPA: hypothetical protein VFJ92_01995 [Gemmatimonadales bacterium]|nr:hypothetical protein [Gemmatimonadales bacterium]
MIQTNWGWVALVGSTVLLPDSRAGRVAGAGLGALVLALAALRVSYGSGGLPGNFAAVEMALVLIGLAALFGGMVRGARGRRGVMAAALAVVGVLLIWGRLGTIAGAARLGESAAALAVVGGMAGLAWAAAHWVLARVRAGSETPVEGVDLRSVAVGVAAVVLAATGSNLFLLGLGVVFASLALWAGAIRPRGLPAALPFLLAIAALIPAGWLFSAIAGDQGLALVTLADLPLSPAAETLLAPLLLVAAWSVAGLWPLPRSRVAGITGTVGVLLLARVAFPALPGGLEHWRPLAFPILAIGVLQGTASGRWPAAMTGGALMALASGSAEGPTAAWCLGGAALAAQLVARLWPRHLVWVRCLTALVAGYGVWPAAVAGLRAEVVYTALTVAGIGVLLAAGGRVDPSHGQIHISRLET